MLDRRDLLRISGCASALAALAPVRLLAQGEAFAAPEPLRPIIARTDRIFRVTVCLRPFRAAGPRIELERIGSRRVIHHYGHGGSGWSLSWGSAAEAVPLALAGGARDIAVVGAGAIGMTTAIAAQRMGAKVTIYSKERFPDVRSARATGIWSPHSRIAMESRASPGFAENWEEMTRRSFAIHQRFLGRPGAPVEWLDRYALSDTPFVKRPPTDIRMPDGTIDHFVDYEHRVLDLGPRPESLGPDAHPFRMPFVRKSATMTFNIAELFHELESAFLLAGGSFVPFDLKSPADFRRIPQKTVINCTGYGARALMQDQSLIPVRGQIAWLLPQAGVNYGLHYDHVSVVARRDGIVVQQQGSDEAAGFNDADEEPDYAEAHASITVLGRMFTPRQPSSPKLSR